MLELYSMDSVELTSCSMIVVLNSWNRVYWLVISFSMTNQVMWCNFVSLDHWSISIFGLGFCKSKGWSTHGNWLKLEKSPKGLKYDTYAFWAWNKIQKAKAISMSTKMGWEVEFLSETKGGKKDGEKTLQSNAHFLATISRWFIFNIYIYIPIIFLLSNQISC